MASKKAALAKTDDAATTLEQVLISGDLSGLSPEQRVNHYVSVCKSVGLNHRTAPFAYINLNGKEVLYALKGCTDQLRSVNNVSLEVVDKSIIGDCLSVTVRATSKGRTDEDTGVVSIKGLHGEALANAHMKALTKGKRRVTLSICGLGMLDETETETIPGAIVEPGPVAKLAAVPDAEVSEPEVSLFNAYAEKINACKSRDDVEAILTSAKPDLDMTEFHELQNHANEHLAFAGVE